MVRLRGRRKESNRKEKVQYAAGEAFYVHTNQSIHDVFCLMLFSTSYQLLRQRRRRSLLPLFFAMLPWYVSCVYWFVVLLLPLLVVVCVVFFLYLYICIFILLVIFPQPLYPKLKYFSVLLFIITMIIIVLCFAPFKQSVRKYIEYKYFVFSPSLSPTAALHHNKEKGNKNDRTWLLLLTVGRMKKKKT